MQRRLAAIMAADVVGYSRMMGEDEAQALAALVELRETLFEPVVADQSGTIVKRMGDGWLVEFANVSDAIACALQVQSGLTGHEVIRLRIGVHVGELTRMQDDVYGDGVNVAARLEALAEPGQVLISDTAFNSLDRKTATQFQGGEDRQLKNIARSVQVWRWPPGGSVTPGSTTQTPQDQKPSIAVLPFDNMSGDAEQEFFSDGITEDIITDLSKVSGLIVIARNSTFAYKNKATDVPQICDDLNVRYLLEGSVRRAGNRVRINAQLIQGDTGTHLWADRFDGSLEDIFEVQDDITRQIVEALRVALTPSEQINRQDHHKVDPEAYECLIRGRNLIYAFRADVASEAQENFERAMALDPNLAARALAGISMLKSTEYFNGWNGAGPERLNEAVTQAQRAVEADPNESRAYHAVAIAMIRTGQLEQSRQAAERALLLDPNFGGALTILGGVRDIEGKYDEAKQLFDQSLRLDPKYHVTQQLLGRTLLAMGRDAEAEACFRDRIKAAPNTDMGRLFLAAICGLTGRQQEAHDLWKEILRINPEFSLEHYQGMVLNKEVGWYIRLMEGLRLAGLAEKP